MRTPSEVRIVGTSPVDWADVGDLYEVWSEDGPRVRRPDSALHVIAQDTRGDVFVYCGPASPYRYTFPCQDAAQRFRDRVLARGTINLNHWAYWRTVYGSDAYVLDGHEEAQWQREMME